MQCGTHVVSDQQIVEQFVLDAGYRRVSRTLEADADITLVGVEVDCHSGSTRRYVDKTKMVIQSLASGEVAADLGFIVGRQRIRPAIAEILRPSDNTRGAAWVDRRDLVGFTVDPDKGREHFGPIGKRIGLVIGKLWDQSVSPGTVFALVTLEGGERDNLVRAHRQRACLRSRRDRMALLFDGCELTADGIKQVEHVGAAPSV